MRRAGLCLWLALIGGAIGAAPPRARAQAGGEEAAETGDDGEGAEGAGEAEAEGDAGAGEEPPFDQEKLEEARERISRGQTLFEAGDHDASLQEFRRVYELLEGHPLRPVALFNIGKNYEKQFRYDQAMEYYRRYLEEAGPDADNRAEVKAKIELLEGLLATVTVQVQPAGQYEVWVDDNMVGENKEEILVPGGSHVIEIRAEGFAPARQEVQVAGRASETVTFELEELAAEYRGVSPIYFWSSVGLTVASAGVGLVFGLMALNESNDVDSQLNDPVQRWMVTKKDTDKVGDLALRADVMFGVAGAFATAALVLAFLTDFGAPPEEEGPEATGVASWSLSPAVGEDSAGVWLRGAF